MGSNPKQAFGLILFLLAWVLIAAGMAGDGMLWVVAGLAMLGFGLTVLLKAKPLEDLED
jgi:hypothetical protein